MSVAKSDQVVNFGPFALNTITGELTKSGVRVRLAGQPLNVLQILLAQPGQVVKSEQLRQKLWGEGTFVDFEHGLHAAINKLRRTLGDSAENARYIETVPGLGYRFIAPLTLTAPQPTEASPAKPQEGKQNRSSVWYWIAAAAACLASFVLGWWLHRSSGESSRWRLQQLTSDAGLSFTPAISRDGTLIAYSSDRGGPGQLDLYVRHVSGSDSLRLTFDGLGNMNPDFAPDGSKIVFHSNRDGGGIYEIPTLGGQPRLIVKEGRDPKFSRDGTKIAYWIGGENLAGDVPGSGTVWVESTATGNRQQMGAFLKAARYPIWSPDGEGLLMVGYASEKDYEGELDWWFVPMNGTGAIKTNIYAPLVGAGLQSRNKLTADPSSSKHPRNIPNPACWDASGSVIFSAQVGSARNLWQTYVSPETKKASGEFKRLTAGAANESEPSCGGQDRISFTSLQVTRDVWSASFDLNAGKVTGPLEQITKRVEREEHAALSRDGRYVAFASPQAGVENIWMREIATGKEWRVAESSLQQRFPVIGPSGNKVAYSVFSEDGTRLIYTANSSGNPEEVCRGCLRATDWSSDEKSLLVFGGNPYRVSALDIASRRQTLLLKHKKYNLAYARYSPDNRWISFTVRLEPNRSKIMVAPIDGQLPVAEDQWIQIAEGGSEDWANWSPDGRILYFTSPRDGYSCIWGQRFDAASHHVLGNAFAALHLHGNASYQQGGWSTAGGRIAMVLTTDSGNVWLLSRAGGQ